MWLKVYDMLNCICDMVEEEGVVFILENLNLLDYFGCLFGLISDVLMLVLLINCLQLKINLDFYYIQIGEGDLICWCEKCLFWIGEVQVVDNLGCCELGIGEINYVGVV